MGLFATAKSSSAYLLKSSPSHKSELNMSSKDGLNDEREEGEIVDEYEDIISSDEEFSMRQRIQELEAKNAELEKIANISAVYGNAGYDYTKKTSSSHPTDRYPLISIELSDEEEYPPAPPMQRIGKHRKSVQHSCSRRKLIQSSSSVNRRRKQSSSSPPPAPLYRASDKLLLSMFHERVAAHSSYSSKRKRKSKKSHVTKSSRKSREYYISGEESEYNFNSYNVDVDDSYENFNSSDPDKGFSLNREELQVALARNSHRIEQVSLKERLIRRKENTNTLNEKTAQDSEEIVEEESKPNSPRDKADTEDNQEEQELRIIALKSAVIRKHLVRKKRNENIAYSPSDFDGVYANTTVSPSINNIDDSEACMEISPVPSPKMILSDDEGMDTKPIDMDIANSDSDCDLPSYEKWIPIEQIPLPKCVGMADELFVPTPLRYIDEKDKIPSEVRFESAFKSAANLDSDVEEEELALRALLLAKMNSPKVNKTVKQKPPKLKEYIPDMDTSLEAETLRQFLISNMMKKTQPKLSSASVLKEAVRRLTARNKSQSPAESVLGVSSMKLECAGSPKTVEETNRDLSQAITDMSKVKIEADIKAHGENEQTNQEKAGIHESGNVLRQGNEKVAEDSLENKDCKIVHNAHAKSNEIPSIVSIKAENDDTEDQKEKRFESISNENCATSGSLLDVERHKDEQEIVEKTPKLPECLSENITKELIGNEELKLNRESEKHKHTDDTASASQDELHDTSSPSAVEHETVTKSESISSEEQLIHSNGLQQSSEKTSVYPNALIDCTVVAEIEALDVKSIPSLEIVEKGPTLAAQDVIATPVTEDQDSIETKSTLNVDSITEAPHKKHTTSTDVKSEHNDPLVSDEHTKTVDSEAKLENSLDGIPPVSRVIKPNTEEVTKMSASVIELNEPPKITISKKPRNNCVARKIAQEAQLHIPKQIPIQPSTSRTKIVKPNKVINQQSTELKRKSKDYASKTAVPTKKLKSEESTHRLITSVEVPQVKQLIIQLRASDPESEYSTMSEEDCDYRVRNFVNRNITIGNEYYDIASPISLPMESPCDTPSRVVSPTISNTPQPSVGKSIVNDFFEAKLDQFLKNVRSKVADKTTKPIEYDAAASQLNTPVDVRHLPEASQQEYRRLINRMKMLERQKQSKNLQVIVKTAVHPTVLDVGLLATEGENKTLARKVLVKNASVMTANPSCHKNTIEIESLPKPDHPNLETLEKCSKHDSAAQKPEQSSQKTTQSVSELKSSKQNLLGLYENSYRKTCTSIISNLDESIELVRLAKEAKMAKLKHEYRLRKIRKEMEEVQRKLQQEQDKITKMYPDICGSHRTIESLKARRVKINKAVTALGKNVIGPNYSMKDEQKSIISEKSKKLAAEIKFVNTLKLSDVEKWGENPTSKALPNNGLIVAPSHNLNGFSLEPDPTVENELQISSSEVPIADSENSPTTSISMPEAIPKMESKSSDTVVPETELNEENKKKDSTNGQEEALITKPVDDKKAPSPQKLGETDNEENEKVSNAKLQDYVSPLSHFRDERQINPNGIVCPYQLMGQCDDKDCKYMHLDNDDDDKSNTVEDVEKKIEEPA